MWVQKLFRVPNNLFLFDYYKYTINFFVSDVIASYMIHLKLLEVWQPFEFSTNKTKNTKENVEWEKNPNF